MRLDGVRDVPPPSSGTYAPSLRSRACLRRQPNLVGDIHLIRPSSGRSKSFLVRASGSLARNILVLVARDQTTFGDLLSANSVPDVLCSVPVKPGSVPSVLSAIPCGDDEDELVP